MREHVLGALKQVAAFLMRGVNLDAARRQAFENDLNGLIAPHLSVLVHRRTKLLASAGPERWSDELDTFLRQSLWPLLGADRDYVERNRVFVTLIVDVAIEREQRRPAQNGAVAMPLVSRFDASWAN